MKNIFLMLTICAVLSGCSGDAKTTGAKPLTHDAQAKPSESLLTADDMHLCEQQLGIAQKEASQFINEYFTRYRGVKQYLDNVLVETRKSGVAKTLFGRIRPIPEINSPQMQLRNFAERTALNSPLQGTAADLIKMAMISIDARLKKEKLAARMILQVHDELLFELPAKEKGKLEKVVKEEMEGVHKLNVPLVVEMGTGPNWRDLE